MRNLFQDLYDDPEFQKYLDHAEKEMLPRMEDSTICMSLIGDSVDIKLCLEIGAAIMYDKPILIVAKKGSRIPLSLRTIAHKIVEINGVRDDPQLLEEDKETMLAAVREMGEIAKFRPRAKGKDTDERLDDVE